MCKMAGLQIHKKESNGAPAEKGFVASAPLVHFVISLFGLHESRPLQQKCVKPKVGQSCNARSQRSFLKIRQQRKKVALSPSAA
jgi:hypothetical protein